MSLQIRTIPIDGLVPFDANPRTITEERLEGLKDSIRSLGMFKPILIWKDEDGNPVVIGGNMRLRALRSLREEGHPVEDVPTIEYKGDEPTARTIALRDNAQDGEWNWHALADYVSDLNGMIEDFDSDLDLLSLSGLDASTIEDLQALASTKTEALEGLGLDDPDPTDDPVSDPEGDPTADQDPDEVGTRGEASDTLAEDFVVPPFTILNQRSGPWRRRKELWDKIGMRSDLGRGGHVLSGGSETFKDPSIYTHKRRIEKLLGRDLTVAEFLRDHYRANDRSHDERVGGLAMTSRSKSGRDPSFYNQKRAVEAKIGRELTTPEFERDYYVRQGSSTGLSGSGTSVFDPVLAEILTRWFAPTGGRILDPFAGGSVRGIVSALCGFEYVGIDLRPEQVEENGNQWSGISGRVDRPDPRWVAGNSLDIDDLLDEEERFDFLLTCPPYGDLEVYSDDEEDLSTMDWPDFLSTYREIITRSAARVRDNRFAAIVVGDFRDKRTGCYRNFVGETVRAFLDAGFDLYNEAILMSPVGSWPVRLRRIFGASRKMAKVHQNVLIFFKGDPKQIRGLVGGALDPETSPIEDVPVSPDSEDLDAIEPTESTEPVVDRGVKFSVEVPEIALDPESPAWAKGRSVSDLKQIAQVFKSHDTKHVLGAFGAVKENTIAAWFYEGALRVIRSPEGETVGAFRKLDVSRKKSVRDFTKRKITIPPGVVHVPRLAVFQSKIGPEDCARAIRSCAGRMPIVYEGWIEDRFDRAVALSLGLAHFGTKISAASEQRGLFVQSSTEFEYSKVETSHLDHLDVVWEDFPDLVDSLRGAVADRVSGWADHYSGYNKRSSWTALSLRSFGGSVEFIEKPSEMSKRWKSDNAEKMEWEIEDTRLRAQLPEVEPILDAIPGRKERVRLMRLRRTDGELSRHADITDPDAGVEDGKLLRIHVVLETNDGVVFDGWKPGGTKVSRHFPVGSVFYLDTRKPHRAVNEGDSDRVHLVMDVESNPALRSMLRLEDS